MSSKNKVVSPVLDSFQNRIAGKVSAEAPADRVIVDFSKLNITPICINGKFNNHYKDDQHFARVAASFIGTVLPKITSHTYKEICQGGSEGKVLHFHSVDDVHRKTVREVLEEYKVPSHVIDQMFEGNDIVVFSASLGHVNAARIVCHKVNNVLYLLFFDTNHHIYMYEKHVKESLFFEYCPMYQSELCPYMPSECFVVDYLNEDLLRESYGYSSSP